MLVLSRKKQEAVVVAAADGSCLLKIKRTPFKREESLMWIERLICLFRGHQLLSMAAVYSQKLAKGNRLELHYCARCGSAVWTAPPGGAAAPPKWSGTGQA